MHTYYQKLCILSSCLLLQAGCADGREVLGPAGAASAVIGVPEGDLDEEIPEEFAMPVDLFLIGEAGINDSYGSMWALMSAYANRLRLKVSVDLFGTSEGKGQIDLAKDFLLPIPRHSLIGTARAGVQDVCGGVANGSANALAYNEVLLTRGIVRTFSTNQAALSKVAPQPKCPDSTPEEDTVEPVGGNGGGSSGDDGDCVLWGKWVDGILVYTWLVGSDC
ncbi:MAG TPA: hypothetical protein VFZ18_12900 [Longimicrobiaceae bacterium]